MVLFYEEVVVLFSEKSFPAYELCFSHLVEEVVVEVGAALDEAELCLIAVHHTSVKLSLQKESDDKPVDAYEAVVRALVEEQDDGYDDGKGRLEDDVHIAEKREH